MSNEEKTVSIDIGGLRRDLSDYYEGAMFNGSPAAIVDLTKVENASNEEIVKMALKNNIDLDDYIVGTKNYDHRPYTKTKGR